jgi:hypothetical protein
MDTIRDGPFLKTLYFSCCTKTNHVPIRPTSRFRDLELGIRRQLFHLRYGVKPQRRKEAERIQEQQRPAGQDGKKLFFSSPKQGVNEINNPPGFSKSSILRMTLRVWPGTCRILKARTASYEPFSSRWSKISACIKRTLRMFLSSAFVRAILRILWKSQYHGFSSRNLQSSSTPCPYRIHNRAPHPMVARIFW